MLFIVPTDAHYYKIVEMLEHLNHSFKCFNISTIL
jgi:hypothetical protein